MDRRHEETAKLARHYPIADDDTRQIDYLFDFAPCRFALAWAVVSTESLGYDTFMTGRHRFFKERPTGAHNPVAPRYKGILWHGVMQDGAPLRVREPQERPPGVVEHVEDNVSDRLGCSPRPRSVPRHERVKIRSSIPKEHEFAVDNRSVRKVP